MKVELVTVTKDPEHIIAKAARISHRSKSKGREDDKRLLRQLLKAGHMSVFEHAVVTFKITGISRAALAQLTRHRLASFTVESQRYVDTRNNKVIVPPSIQDNPEAYDEFIRLVAHAKETYKRLLELGIRKEDARYALPLGTATSLYLTTNFRELRHIIKVRTDRRAQWEVRKLARKLLGSIMGVAPTVFEDLVRRNDEHKGA